MVMRTLCVMGAPGDDMRTERGEPDGADRPEWTDLASNLPGMGVFREATLRRHRDGTAAGRSWQVGGEGEYSAGQMLARFTTPSAWDRLLRRPPRWRVLHSVPLRDVRGAVRGDIDHVLIGPPGVVTINTKHHRRGTVVVDGDEVVVNGRPTAYIAKARQEANRARTQLTAALAVDGNSDLAAALAVRPLILLVGTMPSVRRGPVGVPVVPLQSLRRTVESLPVMLTRPEVAIVFELARRSTTWNQHPPT